jgi:hypothetical protein
MLLDVMSKIIASFVSIRIQGHLDRVGMKAQCGFTSGVGCTDGSFTVNQLMNKVKDAGFDRYYLFIDFVKAFDSVNREALFAILAKLGIPEHMIKIIKALHANCTVQIKVGEETAEVDSTIGVKQGDNLAPVLFLCFIQAAFESLEKIWPEGGKVRLKSKLDSCLHGRKTGKKDKQVSFFEFWCSLYADDAMLTFDSRDSLIEGTKLFFEHMKRFGLEMHLGRGGKAAKSVAMFVPADYN